MLRDNLYLDNLHEYVHDECRIVTYKWLSRKLDVPTDAAKKMLYAYVEHCQSSKLPRPNIIYCVTGHTDTEQGKMHRVCLVREDDLEATKASLNTLRGVHIYSISKCKIKDSSTLFLAHYDICKEHMASYSKWSPIACPDPLQTSSHHPSTTSSHGTSHTTHSTSHTHTTKGPTTKKNGSTSSIIRKAPNKFPELEEGRGGGGEQDKERRRERVEETRKEKSIVSDDKETLKDDTKGDTAGPVESKNPEVKKAQGGRKQKGAVKGSVASFFNKQSSTVKKEAPPPTDNTTSATVSPPKKTTTSEAQSSPTSSGHTDQKGVVKSSPTRRASPQRDTTVVVQSPVGKKAGGWLKGLNDSDIDDGSDSEDDVVLPVRRKTTSRKEAINKKPADSSAKVTKVPEQRKRKRIQNMSSDEENGGVVEGRGEKGGSEGVATGSRRRKRVKRLKSKMYTTDDGSMVTEKVWESESTDESDPEMTAQRGVGGAKPSLVKPQQWSPAKGTKQSLLMKFFKK